MLDALAPMSSKAPEATSNSSTGQAGSGVGQQEHGSFKALVSKELDQQEAQEPTEEADDLQLETPPENSGDAAISQESESPVIASGSATKRLGLNLPLPQAAQTTLNKKLSEVAAAPELERSAHHPPEGEQPPTRLGLTQQRSNPADLQSTTSRLDNETGAEHPGRPPRTMIGAFHGAGASPSSAAPTPTDVRSKRPSDAKVPGQPHTRPDKLGPKPVPRTLPPPANAASTLAETTDNDSIPPSLDDSLDALAPTTVRPPAAGDSPPLLSAAGDRTSFGASKVQSRVVGRQGGLLGTTGTQTTPVALEKSTSDHGTNSPPSIQGDVTGSNGDELGPTTPPDGKSLRATLKEAANPTRQSGDGDSGQTDSKSGEHPSADASDSRDPGKGGSNADGQAQGDASSTPQARSPADGFFVQGQNDSSPSPAQSSSPRAVSDPTLPPRPQTTATATDGYTEHIHTDAEGMDAAEFDSTEDLRAHERAHARDVSQQALRSEIVRQLEAMRPYSRKGTRLTVNLPGVGKVGLHVRLGDQGLQVDLHTNDDRALELLQREQSGLLQALRTDQRTALVEVHRDDGEAMGDEARTTHDDAQTQGFDERKAERDAQTGRLRNGGRHRQSPQSEDEGAAQRPSQPRPRVMGQSTIDAIA